MADNKEIIKVSLAILEYYDSKMKEWHNENSNSKRYVVFAARKNFPTKGDSEVLYVDDDKLYRWDESTLDYILISSTDSSGETTTLEWETF